MKPRADIIAETVEQTGIDDAMIERLVRTFYDRVRHDALLGPIFEARIADWEPHLERMQAFWSSVVLMSGRYHGQPMEKHLALPVGGAEFDRWLRLFEETATAICPGPAAALFIDRAHRIAESLELGIARQRGILLRKGERLNPPSSQPASAGA